MSNRAEIPHSPSSRRPDNIPEQGRLAAIGGCRSHARTVRGYSIVIAVVLAALAGCASSPQTPVMASATASVTPAPASPTSAPATPTSAPATATPALTSPASAPASVTSSFSPTSALATPAPEALTSALEPLVPTRTRIIITVNGARVTASLDNNAATASLLAQLPLELSFEDYGSQEKIASIPSPLSLDGMPTAGSGEPGTIGYYAPDQAIVLYYETVGSYDGIIPLGTFDNVAAVRDSPAFVGTLTAS